MSAHKTITVITEIKFSCGSPQYPETYQHILCDTDMQIQQYIRGTEGNEVFKYWLTFYQSTKYHQLSRKGGFRPAVM